MRYAEEIKRRVSMIDVCNTYGFRINRGGYINCPFHSERTASMKIYDGEGGYYCFGCHSGGSVIDFVVKYFDLSPSDAAKKLNEDFHLCLPIGKKPTLREHRSAGRAAVTVAIENHLDEFAKAIIDAYCLYYMTLYAKADLAEMRCDPESDEYAEAVKNKDYYSYMWQCWESEARAFD